MSQVAGHHRGRLGFRGVEESLGRHQPAGRRKGQSPAPWQEDWPSRHLCGNLLARVPHSPRLKQ